MTNVNCEQLRYTEMEDHGLVAGNGGLANLSFVLYKHIFVEDDWKSLEYTLLVYIDIMTMMTLRNSQTSTINVVDEI